jgi:hypothetical protein
MNANLLKRAVVNALVAVGMKEAEIKFSGSRIELGGANISVSPALIDGKRVWKAEGRHHVMRMEDAHETEVTTVLFTVPLESDLLLARKLAIHVSVTKIDAALDATVTENASSLQRTR